VLIIYRKADGQVCSVSGTNSLLPEGPRFEVEVQNAIRKHGGSPDDYGEYRLHDVQDAAIVQAVLGAGSVEMTFHKDGAPSGIVVHPRTEEPRGSTSEPEPTEIEALRAAVAEIQGELRRLNPEWAPMKVVKGG
jgi:hypothetical protein